MADCIHTIGAAWEAAWLIGFLTGLFLAACVLVLLVAAVLPRVAQRAERVEE